MMRSLVAIAMILAATSTAYSGVVRSKHRGDRRAAMKAKRIVPTKRFHPSTVSIRQPGGQSYGAPWDGVLRNSEQLADGDGYFVRRPLRSFGTRSTIDAVKRAVTTVREQFPDSHVLAIGDISAQLGGPITGHRSHQSGRDVDVGLIYKTKPDSFPYDFALATDDNLDCEATYALINEFADATADGGVQVIFLDFDVQRMIYDWAVAHGEDPLELQKLFQFPNRDARGTLVQHAPNHGDHLHVRFACPKTEPSCSN